MTDRSMLAHLRAVPWRLDQRAFKAWRQGLTGAPLRLGDRRGAGKGRAAVAPRPRNKTHA
jgi:hypothetical protein